MLLVHAGHSLSLDTLPPAAPIGSVAAHGSSERAEGRRDARVLAGDGAAVAAVMRGLLLEPENGSVCSWTRHVTVTCANGTFGRVTGLHFSGFRGTRLDGALANLTQLATLEMVEGRLASIDAAVGSMDSLSTVNLTLNDLVEIPDPLTRLRALKTLDLRNNGITLLPASLARLAPTLTKLCLNHNKLTTIGSIIGEMENLQMLTLHNNDISTVAADGVGRLSSLAVLTLHYNRIETLPDDIFADMDSLQVLWLLSNQLTALPSSIGQLATLTLLQAESNLLETLPSTMGASMAALKTLIVQQNRLASIPDELFDMPSLGELDLRVNRLETLPSGIGRLSASLTSLTLSQNRLVTLPVEFCELEQLETLRCTQTLIAELPACFGRLGKLQDAYLGRNQLQSLPESIGNLTMLQNLDVHSNRIQVLPSSISQLRSLTIFNFRDNLIANVPFSFESLPSLSSVEMEDNMLTNFPLGIETLQVLDELNVGNNLLSSLPHSFASMPALRILTLSGNVDLSGPLPDIPPSLDVLLLARNDFYGPIPASYSRLGQTLDLTGNDRIDGTLGVWLCEAHGLKSLLLSRTATNASDTASCGSSSRPLRSLHTLDLSKNSLTDVDVADWMVDMVTPSLRYLDLSDNPLGSVQALSNAFGFDSGISLSFFGLGNTSIQWASFLTVPRYDSDLPFPLLQQTTGVLDLSSNNLTLGGYTHEDMPTDNISIVLSARQVRCENCMLDWGPSSVSSSNGFGVHSDSLFRESGVVLAPGTPYKGNLPSPDDAPLLREIDIYSADSESTQFDGRWTVVPSHETRIYVSYACPSYVVPEENGVVGYKATVHPKFYEYRFCRCLQGFFGVVPRNEGETCTACLEGGTCTHGDGRLEAKNRWPVFDQVGTLVRLVACPGSHDASRPSCKQFAMTVHDSSGGCPDEMRDGHGQCPSVQWTESTMVCGEGHVPDVRLCSRCQSGYFSSGGLCHKCTPALSWLPVVLAVGKLFISAALLVSGVSPLRGPLRLFILHLSLFGVLTASSRQHPLPGVSDVFSWLGAAGPDVVVPGFECVSSAATYEGRFAVAASLPAILAAVAAIVWLVGRVFGHTVTMRRAPSVFIFLWLASLLTFTSKVFAPLSCTDFGSNLVDGKPGLTFVSSALWIACDASDRSWQIMSAVALSFGAIAVAATVLAQFAVTRRAASMTSEERCSMGVTAFLFSAYRPRFYFWELTVTVRRLSLAFVIGLSPYQSVALPSGVFLVLFASLIIHLRCHPYTDKLLNRLETMSLASLIFGFFIIVLLQGSELTDEGRPQTLFIVLQWSIVVVNALVLFIFAAIVARSKFRNGRDLVSRMRSRELNSGRLDKGLLADS